MIAAAPRPLIQRLPKVRGRLKADAPLAPLTWFKVGGPAEVLFRPADLDDLVSFLAACSAPGLTNVPRTVIGATSNLLVRDGGVPGVVIRLGGAFAGIEADGDDALICGAAALDGAIAEAAADAGLAGFEFLAGIPGSLGGAVRMNAGAHGGEIKDILDWAEILDPAGQAYRWRADELGLAYRTSALTEGWIVTRCRLVGRPDAPKAIAARMAEIKQTRRDSQPTGGRTGGSTFRNPPGAKAWELIDRAGCRGLTRGGAMVSEKHCNFLLNTGTASAADLEGLGEEVRRRVRAACGVDLSWEIRRIGQPEGGAA
ncbi:UDP-N-acetylmuramate dehydrogenase [Roseospirillum parvum]|uniref:UDP-N-acetylenolpyruvoylglucosamine reductase n=1 Tax=Roseospirillum parvum TaxID=83401 RepID=A0A1G7UB70_9PROT|nr:UDP-N-acetylmuramate dehydrogenase [Roseospirillum parvum]SDG44707.1 UDP-N-acetylmuramate dehydrogenase [Roseospirillum parvum]